MSEYGIKLQQLREVMEQEGVDGFIVPRTDEYQNEYVPDCYERLAWLTGFTGSAGYAIVLKDKAVVMSNSIYTLQLKEQVDQSQFMLSDYIAEPIEMWIENNANDGDVIGYDPKLFAPDQVSKISEALDDISLKSVPNLIDEIWTQGRPSLPSENVVVFPVEIAGKSSQQKRLEIAQQLKKKECEAAIITKLDSIAWLLNIRGADIDHTPVVLSSLVLHNNGEVDWFVDAQKLLNDVMESLGDEVRVHAQQEWGEYLHKLGVETAKKNGMILFDPQRSSAFDLRCLKETNVGILNAEDPCVFPKSIKTTEEQEAMKAAHIRDGAAVVKFLYWLEQNAASEKLTELDVDQKLIELRSAYPEFRDTSFDTISGFGSNGAIVHYRVTSETNRTITKDNLLLVDSGAQYTDGTTDITRTMAIGKPSEEMMENYTRVLIGHVRLAMAKLPKGAKGKDADELARSSLSEVGLNYGHGTGHGVGCYLCVHEDAARISPLGEDELKAGMIISNEPGYYKTDHYGIRIENLVLVQSEGDGVSFETITMAPYDRNLIVIEMLTKEEKKWVDNYHAQLSELLLPYLGQDEMEWLRDSCLPL